MEEKRGDPHSPIGYELYFIKYYCYLVFSIHSLRQFGLGVGEEGTSLLELATSRHMQVFPRRNSKYATATAALSNAPI